MTLNLKRLCYLTRDSVFKRLFGADKKLPRHRKLEAAYGKWRVCEK